VPIFLIVSLCLHLLEISPLSLYPRVLNPKTCCGRPVCLCTHPQGAPCPFKKGLRKINLSQQNHKFCHLKKEVTSNVVFFKRAPCDSDQPKSNVPGYSRDFDLNRPFERLVSFEPEFSLALSAEIIFFLFDHRLDRPPRTISFLSL
jgi:hypothetical protein